jgi:hypothetical protein
MATTSWIDSVWKMRGAKSPVVGRVRAVDGSFVTLAVFGLGDQEADGAEVIAGAGGLRRYARISLEALLQHWTPIHGVQAHAQREM